MTGCLKINKPQEDNYKLEPLAESRKIIRSRKMAEVPRGWVRRPCSSWGLGTWRGSSGGSMSQAATGDSQGMKGDRVGWLGATHGGLRRAGWSCAVRQRRQQGWGKMAWPRSGVRRQGRWAALRWGLGEGGRALPAQHQKGRRGATKCRATLLSAGVRKKERKGGKDGGSSLMAAGRVLQKSGKFMVVLVIACKSSRLTKL